MLILMAINAEQFPIAAIRRIIIVIVIFMMDRKLSKPLALEFTPAAPADWRKKSERLFTVTLHPNFALTSNISNELLVALRPHFVRWHANSPFPLIIQGKSLSMNSFG